MIVMAQPPCGGCAVHADLRTEVRVDGCVDILLSDIAHEFFPDGLHLLNPEAAIPFGCLSVLVTWLNFATISPSSQAAIAAPGATLRASADTAAVTNLIWVSSYYI